MAYIAKKTTVDGVKPIGSSLFGLCSTASSTAVKSVTMSDFNVLVSGVTIHVYFTYGNTASAPMLKVGSTSAVAIKRNGQANGKWSSGSVVSFTYDGSHWIQNDADESGVTYTLSKSGSTITLTGSDGSTQSVTDSNTEYGLDLYNGRLSLVEGGGSSEVIIHDDDTRYGLSFVNGVLSLVENGSEDQVTIPDENTTYILSMSGDVLSLTDSNGHSDDIIIPTGTDTTYTLTISGHTLTLTPSDGTPQSVTIPDEDSMPHLTLDATTIDNTDGNFTFSGSGAPWAGTDWVGFQIGDSADKFQVVRSGNNLLFRYDDLNGQGWSSWFTLQNQITAGTGLSMSGDTINHSNSVTALTTASLRKVKYDAQGHITGSSAVTKSDIIDLGVHDIYFKTHSVNNINIAAGAYKNVSMAGLIDGYTLAGIVAISKTGSNNGYVVISAFYYNSPANDIFVHLVNTNSSAVTIGLNVRAIYYK